MAAESPLLIILNMIILVITNTIGTVVKLFAYFFDLLKSLGFVSTIGGPFVFLLSVVIIGLVGFFLLKFIFGAGKGIILLIIVGIILLWIIILSLM